MWKENFHYHEFILSGKVMGSITVHRTEYEIKVSGKIKYMPQHEKIKDLKSYVEQNFAKPN